MPYQKLTRKLKRFSKRRIRQLFDDARIFVAWYSSLSKGKILRDRKTGRKLTKQEVIKRFAKVRGLLWALGYPPKAPGREDTKIYREVFKKAFPLMRKYHRRYFRRVVRLDKK